jgi:hypothetical protein
MMGFRRAPISRIPADLAGYLAGRSENDKEPRKLGKRSEVVQAQRHHPELNLGDADEEAASREGDQLNPQRPKAGR